MKAFPSFVDIAQALSSYYKISNPIPTAIVEKEFFTIDILRKLENLMISDDFILVFSGGTCLTKVYLKNSSRMSEDIDLKMIPNKEYLEKSKSQQKKQRKEFGERIIDHILNDQTYDLVSQKKRNEYRYQEFQIRYPRQGNTLHYLRPEIKIELTQSVLYQDAVKKSIESYSAKIMKSDSEVKNFPCSELESILAEKLLSLLRRTAGVARGIKEWEDERLIRHAYDLYVTKDLNYSKKVFHDIFWKAAKSDQERFSQKHTEYRTDIEKELSFGLEQLKATLHFEERYDRFVGPLVFDSKPPIWEEVLANLEVLFASVLKK
ncbi:MAG TPA: nucleotidyl transferase AbiEii/AbiGii toxin family protein [Oligoflexia bacterium]|nr:nucleotidyl transferase AbiEii/AbiGii toxin family protein [Oligoflexia bacterium]HMR24616.1 nucleotidyl transferase AbiEii/AbiGii toxin family protein [Oligoflexia bacterium]